MKIFVTLVSVTVEPRKLKLGIYFDSGWIYYFYPNDDDDDDAYSLLHFFIFLSLHVVLEKIKNPKKHFSVEPIYLKLYIWDMRL